jgi:hypothetical protein
MYRLTTLFLAAMLWPASLSAQTDNRLGVGASVTTRVAGSSSTTSSSDVGFDVRLGHEHDGWGWAYSFFSWFDTDLEGRPSVSRDSLGRLRMRPFMAGYGHTWTRGRYSITADLLGGFSFNSFDLDPSARTEYLVRGASDIDAGASNTFVMKPEVQVWYDVSPKFGVKISGGYLVSRPTVSIKSTLGEDARPVKADTILITVGIVYSIF